MFKPYKAPGVTAKTILTNLLSDFNYKFDDWNDEVWSIEMAVASARELEMNELFMPAQGFVVDVWSGIPRVMTKEEHREYKLKQLTDKLGNIDSQRKKLKKMIAKLESEKAEPFNLKEHEEEKRRERENKEDNKDFEGD